MSGLVTWLQDALAPLGPVQDKRFFGGCDRFSHGRTVVVASCRAAPDAAKKRPAAKTRVKRA
jgi:hypothetical protein